MNNAERYNLQKGKENRLTHNSKNIDEPIDAYILNRLKIKKQFEEYQEQKKFKKNLDEAVEKVVEKEIKNKLDNLLK